MAHHSYRRKIRQASPFFDLDQFNADLLAPLLYASTASDGQILYQDTAGTIPVDTVGDPVASYRYDDELTEVQPSAASQPTWQGTDTGVQFDGSDDLLEIGDTDTFRFLHETGGFVGMRFRFDARPDGVVQTLLRTGASSGANGIAVFWDNRDPGGQVDRDHRLTVALYDGTSGSPQHQVGVTVDDADPHSLWVRIRPGRLEMWLDGELVRVSSTRRGLPTGSQFNSLRIGGYTSSSQNAAITVDSVVIGEDYEDGDSEALVTYDAWPDSAVRWTTQAPDLPDYSWAGYDLSESDLSTRPISGTTYDVTQAPYNADNTGATDSAAAFQSAIDDAIAAGGGLVYAPAGTYIWSSRVHIDGSNVVLRGDGPTQTKIYSDFVQANQTALLSVGAKTGAWNYEPNTSDVRYLTTGNESDLASDAARYDTTVEVVDGSGYSVGDEVEIGWVLTDDFASDHNTARWTNASSVWDDYWHPWLRNKITAIDGNTLTMEVPLAYPAKTRDSATVRAVSDTVENVGVEDLAISNINTGLTGSEHTNVVLFFGCVDSWMINVHDWESPESGGAGDRHIGTGLKMYGCRGVTVEDCQWGPPALVDSFNGQPIWVLSCDQILFHRCHADGGRHPWKIGGAGGAYNVLVDCSASAGDLQPDFHNPLSGMLCLVERFAAVFGSEASMQFEALDRGTMSGYSGQTATMTTFWGCARMDAIESEQGAQVLPGDQGYIIASGDGVGTDADAGDWVEAVDETDLRDGTTVDRSDPGGFIKPMSLFARQLADRT